MIGAANNAGLEMLMNMFGGLGAGSLGVPNRSDGGSLLPFGYIQLFCFHLLRS